MNYSASVCRVEWHFLKEECMLFSRCAHVLAIVSVLLLGMGVTTRADDQKKSEKDVITVKVEDMT